MVIRKTKTNMTKTLRILMQNKINLSVFKANGKTASPRAAVSQMISDDKDVSIN
jgi:hypothetical protein